MGRLLASIGWLVVVSLSCGMAVGATTVPSVSAPAAVVSLHGEINDFSKSLFIRHFNQAKAIGAAVVIVDINTYGGLVTSGLEISQFIKQQRDVQTIAFVNTKAISAGAMIALACNQIAMAQVATFGDCAPIMFSPTGGITPMPATERAKAESPILADFRNSAQRNGYNEQLVLSMVSLSQVVYWVESDDGKQRRFVDEPTYKVLTASGAWKAVPGVPSPLGGGNTLLTVDSELAIKLGLAKESADSVSGLLRQRNLRLVGTFESGGGEALIEILGSDAVRAILLSIFFTCLYVALHAPGHGAAEVLAVLTLSALLGVPLLTGYAQWWEIVVILIGIGLLAMEIFVIPGFGVTGFAGLIMLVGGLLLTFIAPEPGRSPLSVPNLPVTWQSLQNGMLALVAALIGSLMICWWIRRYLPQIPMFNRLILNTVVGSTESAMVGSTGNPQTLSTLPAIGAEGKVVTDLRPGGLVEFRDAHGVERSISAVSGSGFIGKGEKVVVRQVSDSHVIVHKVQT